MDYQEAEKIRKKSFGTLLGEQEGGLGSSLKSAISQKTKAKITGIKETFDPMNMARAVGGKTGAAIYGKIFKRDDASMERFAGAKKKKTISDSAGGDEKLAAHSTPSDVLGLIYRLMLRADEEKKTQEIDDLEKKKADEKEENDRNEQIIKAVTGRTKKKPTRKEKAKEKKEAKKEEKKAPSTEEKKAPPREKGKKPSAEKVPAKEAPKQPPKEAPKAAKEAPKEAPKTAKEAPVKPTAEKVPSQPGQLGNLSSKFETGGVKNSGAVVGWDSTGGTSYGTYQIAAKVGGMDSFLKFAESKGEKDIVSRLRSVGPADTGSTKGPFVDEWKKISAEKGKSFEDLQHAFIEESQYKPAAKALLKSTKYDVESQSPAIKDVFFSTVVQHGPGGARKIFDEAITKSGGADADPAKIISNVYEIRATKFKSSTDKVQESVKKRFVQEKALALDMLNNKGFQIDSASKENKDLKQTASKDANAQTLNNTTNIKQQASSPPPQKSGDDRNAYLKKAQG